MQMTREELVSYKAKRTFSPELFEKLEDLDFFYALDKATKIVNNYLNFTSGSSFDYIIADIAVDILRNEVVGSIYVQPISVPDNVTSLREGDTTISFGSNSNSNSTSSSSSSSVTNDEVYLVSYRDRLDRDRKMKF